MQKDSGYPILKKGPGERDFLLHNCPLKGIGVRDFYAFFDFFLLAGRFPVACGSEFREILAYLEVGSCDLEPIHEKNHFHEISDILMKSRIYSWVKFKKSNHKNALEAHFCNLISGEKPNSWLFDENVKKSNHAPLSLIHI